MTRIERRILNHWHRATPDQLIAVAGILAALSPVCAWEYNVLGMISLIRTGQLPAQATYQANINKATRILTGERPSKVLGGNKVKSFFACILRPHGQAVCVDRHAGALAMGQWTKWTKRESNSMPTYRKVRAAYLNVAHLLQRPVSEVQAVTWLVRRESVSPSERLYSAQYHLWEGRDHAA